MKEKLIKTQKQLDALKEIKINEKIIIKAELKLSKIIEVCGKLIIEKQVLTSWENYFRARESAHVEARGSAHVVAWGSAHVVARESAHVEAWESAHVEAWESAHVVARESAHVVARESAHVEARGSAHVEAWGSAHVVARESASVRLFEFSSQVKLSLFGVSIVIIPKKLKLKIKKSKTSYIHRIDEIEDWFERNAIKKTKNVILYKRVSKDFQTQEGTANETEWKIGTIVEHPNWNPKSGECGAGKFHACSRPYFADEFRSKTDDRYIAIRVAIEDAYTWPNPEYPYKIGFRKGKILYECDRYGNKVQSP